MSGYSFDSSEVATLADDLAGAGPRVEERAPLVVAKSGYDVEAMAKTIVPVDTHATQNSIQAEPDGLEVAVGPHTNYSPYLEKGTHNRDGSVRMRARPFMGPALEANAGPFGDAILQVGAGSVLG
jgi:HK97 gp10 family phage protein